MGQVQEEQKKGLLQRPADLVMVTYLVLAAFFTLFRGLVSLPWLPPSSTSRLPSQPSSPKFISLFIAKRTDTFFYLILKKVPHCLT